MGNFSLRDEHVVEKMDDPSCDISKLKNTYKQFTTINQLLSRWRWIYLKYLKPIIIQLENPSLLDIGFGGGDVVINLSHWAKVDGINLQIFAIETDERAVTFAKANNVAKQNEISFRHASLKDIIKNGEKFDLVISNHVLHHLSSHEAKVFIKDSEIVANRLVMHNDLVRNKLAYGFFYPSRYIFKNSFIFEDGLTSIRRAFTKNELKSIVSDRWNVKNIFPFRMIAYTYR